jgi:competence ComEA-like helix-hairpin-helix protein
MELNQCLININSCTAEDLTRIPGVGPALAQKIIEFRNARGTITDVNQLRQIPGVGNKTFRRIVGAGPSPRGKVVRLVNHLLGAPQDRELTLQEIVRLTAQQPGVAGCIMATDDGMFVTGQLPASLDAQTISAFAPQLFRRVSRYVKELKVGQVRRFSLFTDEQPVSIFYAGKIYLVVIHAPNRFSKTLLNRCERIAKEINRMCTNHVTV